MLNEREVERRRVGSLHEVNLDDVELFGPSSHLAGSSFNNTLTLLWFYWPEHSTPI
jgi:hypothetical protein